MSSSIKNVVVVGGSGNLGKPVVDELVKAGFQVTVFTRENSSATFPAGVNSKKVNYESVDSLKSALEGQDAVVSTIATVAIGGQYPLVDAAVAAKVKRFIPSEFGVNTRILGDLPIGKILQGKIKTLDYIDAKSKENPDFTWTGISTGLFFDWGLLHGSVGYDKKTRTATIYDSGNEPVQVSNLPFIGRAVAAILSNPSKTANKYLTIASFNPTQNEILDILEKETGEKWKVTHATTAEAEKVGVEKLGRGDFSSFLDLLRARIFRDGAGLAVKGESNAATLVGLQEEDLSATLKEWLKN
ncbi:hypothetical protein F4809DRAFT_600540 [Biscogniauxia mediterranea]|nr:hypothetical protein F4809DRAFT_600540 [Biscogniauxia mediterranea]